MIQKAGKTPSLSEVHESVHIRSNTSTFRKWLAVAGPALMVSVGYMDPGNWATDLAGGSRYQYALIWVLLVSNIMAILLQSLSARLGIVAKRDLAQASRETYPSFVNIPLYILAEIAITAMDLAEVIGSAIALQLLFGLPLAYGVILTTLDVLILLSLTAFGIRKLEAVILALVGTIGIAFIIEIFFADPAWGELATGFIPSLPDSHALYIAIGILGATVMPHNLYLHSALVQTRKIEGGRKNIKELLKLNFWDSAISLNLAFFVNAAILVMAAAVFYKAGHYAVTEIQDAHKLLEPLVGAKIAPIAFAVALLAAGQSSTITGTLAGQIVMEGYLHFRIRPWLRRLITRLLAVIPALFVILYFGERSTGNLLILSQVILSLQLPFAVIPLIHFVSNKKRMGEFVISTRTKIMSWTVGLIIVALNAKLVIDELFLFYGSHEGEMYLFKAIIVFFLIGSFALLGVITFFPYLMNLGENSPIGNFFRAHAPAPKQDAPSIHPPLDITDLVPDQNTPYSRIAIALDFESKEAPLISEALRLANKESSTLFLFHVVESPASRRQGRPVDDIETATDRERLQELVTAIHKLGYQAEWKLGAGNVVITLERLIKECAADLVILATHGHTGMSDVIYGSTADALRHRIQTKVLLLPFDAK